jgi:hypothetical protein
VFARWKCSGFDFSWNCWHGRKTSFDLSEASPELPNRDHSSSNLWSASRGAVGRIKVAQSTANRVCATRKSPFLHGRVSVSISVRSYVFFACLVAHVTVGRLAFPVPCSICSLFCSRFWGVHISFVSDCSFNRLQLQTKRGSKQPNRKWNRYQSKRKTTMRWAWPRSGTRSPKGKRGWQKSSWIRYKLCSSGGISYLLPWFCSALGIRRRQRGGSYVVNCTRCQLWFFWGKRFIALGIDAALCCCWNEKQNRRTGVAKVGLDQAVAAPALCPSRRSTGNRVPPMQKSTRQKLRAALLQ